MDDCIEWHMSHGSRGYGQLQRGGKKWRAHRWAWTQEHGPIPEGMHVRHKCDNPSCVNINHLELGTHVDNMKDKEERGRTAKGESHGRCKLTDKQVAAIRATTGKSQRAIAAEYGVGQTQINRILRNKQRISYANA